MRGQRSEDYGTGSQELNLWLVALMRVACSLTACSLWLLSACGRGHPMLAACDLEKSIHTTIARFSHLSQESLNVYRMQCFSPSDPNTLDSHRKRCLVLEFFTFGSQHARQVAPSVTTVDVFGQDPPAFWLIIGIENRITKFLGGFLRGPWSTLHVLASSA